MCAGAGAGASTRAMVKCKVPCSGTLRCFYREFLMQIVGDYRGAWWNEAGNVSPTLGTRSI